MADLIPWAIALAIGIWAIGARSEIRELTEENARLRSQIQRADAVLDESESAFR